MLAMDRPVSIVHASILCAQAGRFALVNFLHSDLQRSGALQWFGTHYPGFIRFCFPSDHICKHRKDATHSPQTRGTRVYVPFFNCKSLLLCPSLADTRTTSSFFEGSPQLGSSELCQHQFSFAQPFCCILATSADASS